MVHFGAEIESHPAGRAQVVAPQWVTRADGRFEFPGQIAVLCVSRLLTRLRTTDRTTPGSRRQGFWLQISLPAAAASTRRPRPSAYRSPPTDCRIDLRPGARYSVGVGRLEGSPRAGAGAEEIRPQPAKEAAN